MSTGEDTLAIRFEAGHIAFLRYPFMKHNRGRTIPAEEISEVVVGFVPPCFRTVDGEYLFVRASDLEALVDFSEDHDIPFKQRVDIWSMILDPFLDTALDEDYLANTAAVLEENGVSDTEIEEMRKTVGTRMRLLTYRTYEWGYYGLFDVLEQMSALTFTTGWAFDRFYDHAMALADRGKATLSSPDEMRRFFAADVDPFV